ncbi:MAG: BREX system P-loop protein BrxC [Acidobacteriota bacterium]
MKNREIFQRDPSTSRLLNDGVATVEETRTPNEIDTLRYELEHFVCEGQYKEGMIRILESYIGSVDSTVQPAAWISGFYGCGKSHLLKMLRHLWVDTMFADGATARGLAQLPLEVQDLLRELGTLGKRCGGLHAVSGKLPSGEGSNVRLTILSIISRSKGLPETLPETRFCLWLMRNGNYEKVRRAVEAEGRDFLRELSDLYVSPVLARAILDADPTFAPDINQVHATLEAQFRDVHEISTMEFTRLTREILSVDGRVPCTVVVLDEVQLFIGDSAQRSAEVQEVAEALCKQLDSRVMLIGAGQTALAGSVPMLQRLRGRFTISVELSDLDVETVTRRVVLAKKADRVKAVKECLDHHAGEIDRQLAGTAIASRVDDQTILVDDYPLLPVRRRFWEHSLRAVDVPGTTAQLRTQLRIVHDAVRDTAEQPLGTVVPGDFIFGQLQTDLLRTGVLLRESDQTIQKLDDGTPSGKLARRLCGLIFLIRKLPRGQAGAVGVSATPEMLSDLLVSDLGSDGTLLRKDVPLVLEQLVRDGKLIKLDDGYSLQTREGSEWDREFHNRQSRLAGDESGISNKRSALIAAAISDAIGGIRLVHGRSKAPRKLVLQFGGDAPTGEGHEIPVWVRDGWGESESRVLNDARAAGTESPIVYVFVSKSRAEDLKQAIVDAEAARSTIDFKGTPNTDEGREAFNAMTTRRGEAEVRRNAILREVIENSKVLQGGGAERLELSFVEKVRTAAEASLDRLFPHFRVADHDKWDGVISRARSGDESALQVVDWHDKPEKHPVCSAIRSAIGAGKRGKEVRSFFENSPYGWPRDAVDGALIVLHTAGQVRVGHGGVQLKPGQLDQAKIAMSELRVEAATLDVGQRIKLRKLFQSASVACKPGEESTQADRFLAVLLDLADQAGGDPPMPPRPSTTHIEALRGLTGNEQLAAMVRQGDGLEQHVKAWSAAAEHAAKRRPAWEMLCRLLRHASGLPDSFDLLKQTDAVRADRRLLDASDPVPAIQKGVASILRPALNKAHNEYETLFSTEKRRLDASESWQRLSPAQREEILAAVGIAEAPTLDVSDDVSLLRSLDECSLGSWKMRTSALPQQFIDAALAAAKSLEPKTQRVHLTSGTLKTPAEVKDWVTNIERDLLDKVADGPIVIS